MMKYAEKMKIRLITAIVMCIIGLILIMVGITMKNEMASPFGTMVLIIGISRIVQYIRITGNKDVLKKREIAESDERNVMIWTKARALTFSVYIIISAIAIVVFYMMNMEQIARILSYSLWAFVVIYWISYFIISRKY